MDLLLDTHAFIWWDSDAPQLGVDARAAIGDQQNRVFVSAASVWEIGIKQRLNRIDFSGSPSEAINRNGFIALAITAVQAERAASLPPLHQDPFDRILIAQALERRLVLVTSDAQILQYAVPQIGAR